MNAPTKTQTSSDDRPNLENLAELDKASQPATVQIVSVPPVKVADTDRVVSWSRRSTEKTPVVAEMRYRAVIVPAASLKVPDDACRSKFASLLQSTIHDLADARFQAHIKDQMHATEMPAALLSLDNVLAFWAEEKQRATVDAAKIIEWLKASATFKTLSLAQQAGWLNRLPKIAAPSYKGLINKEQAAAIISKISEDDTEHAVCVFCMTRLNNILGEESTTDVL